MYSVQCTYLIERPDVSTGWTEVGIVYSVYCIVYSVYVYCNVYIYIISRAASYECSLDSGRYFVQCTYLIERPVVSTGWTAVGIVHSVQCTVYTVLCTNLIERPVVSTGWTAVGIVYRVHCIL